MVDSAAKYCSTQKKFIRNNWKHEEKPFLVDQMFQHLFQITQSPPSVNAVISSTAAPKDIVRACIGQLKGLVQRKDTELRDWLQDIVDSLPPDDEDHYIDDICVDQKFLALKVACERSSQPKLVQATLSVIEKLISTDLLVGDEYWTERPVPGEDVNPSEPTTPERPQSAPKLVMDVVVETVFRAAQKASADDEETHLLAIRCVLSCVLSKHRLVHGNSLMTCVRTCYLINKDSRSTTAQTTSQAALTQILKTLNDRLVQALEAPLENTAPAIGDWACGYTRNLLNKTVILTDPDNESNDNRGRIGWCVVCGEAADYYCRKAREPVCSMLCKQANLRRIQIVSKAKATPPKLQRTQEYRDVLTVFKSLCRLSTSKSGSSSVDPNSSIVKSTRLSLELIASMLDAFRTTLFTDNGFIEMIKTSLVECLLTNSVSPISGIFNVALDIFSSLLASSLKPHMLGEIGLFVHQVLVYIVESPNSPEAHKIKAIEIMAKMDSDLLLKLFQQFDCCMDQKNVVEQIISSLAKTARSSGGKCPLLASQALLGIINSLCSFVFKQHPQVKEVTEDDQWVSTDIPGSASVAEPAETVPAAMPSQGKQRKLLLQEGMELFKSKPSKGIDFFVLNGFIDSNEPAAIARAFTEIPNLDKTAIGDYIGENKPANLQVLYALVDRMRFTDMELDQALRQFLSLFRLPGEAQKIDRIMEKFADRFFKDNPNRYANADSAYVLSFAVIMLNTDLHSPQIKKKMTLEEFVKLGKGINTEIEISQAELERLFHNIQNDEIKLNEDSSRIVNASPVNTSPEEIARRRFELFLRETEQVIQKSRENLSAQHIRRRDQVGSTGAPSDQDVKDIIIISHAEILEGFKAVLAWTGGQDEAGDIENLQSEIIDAVASIIRVSILFDLETVRTLYFTSLVEMALIDVAKAPVLHTTTEAIRAVLNLAANDGNGLGPCWLSTVKLISLIDRMSLIQASGSKDPRPAVPEHNPSIVGRFLLGRSSQNPTIVSTFSELEKINSEIFLSTIDTRVVDSIFLGSVGLNPSNILALTSGLAEVASEELSENPPRLFSCQRLVELADYNMSRQIRIVWSKLWNIIAPCFVRIATQSNYSEEASLFAIDSLRQLAFKFLSKPELGNYHFQTEFMKPFSIIMSTSPAAQDMVLSVMDSLVKQVASNIKSGWISVFAVIAIACKSGTNVSLMENATWLLSEINTNAFSVALLKGENFREFMHCLVLLGQNNQDVRMTEFVFTAIRNHIDRLADSESGIEDLTSHWLTLTKGLASLLLVKQKEALSLLFVDIMTDRVQSIDLDTVQIILRAVLIPWLDDAVHAAGSEDLISETSDAFMASIISNFDSVFSRFIVEIFNYYSLLILHDRSERIGTIGLDNVKKLIGIPQIRNRPDQVIESLTKLVSGTVPRILLENTNVTTITSLPFNPDRVLCLCATHLSVIQLVGDFVTEIDLNANSWKGVCTILTNLEESKNFAIRFNSEVSLREKLKNLGFMRDLRQLPGLLKQERAALTVSLKILFLVTQSVDKFTDVEICRNRLRDVCNEIVDAYVAKETKLGTVAVQVRDSLIDEIEREMNGLVPVISSVIVASGFGKMHESEFEINKQWIFDVLVKLVHVNNLSIRQSVAAVLASKFRP